MPSGSSGSSISSGGLKRPYDALDAGKYLDQNEALLDQRRKSIEKSAFDNNDDAGKKIPS
jgi:hypothetical protein